MRFGPESLLEPREARLDEPGDRRRLAGKRGCRARAACGAPTRLRGSGVHDRRSGGLLAALALAPAGRRTPWERMLAVAGGWMTGWLAAGFYVWADALFRIVNECVSTFRTSSWPCRCRFSRPTQRPAALQAER